MDLSNNIDSVISRINASARKSNRNPSEIHLIAVSKTISIDIIKEAAAKGLFLFGENRIEEAEEKVRLLPEFEWHFIGHIQSRKLKRVLLLFKWIHSVDSLKLIQKISKEAEELNLSPVRVFLQLNLSGEAQKYGFCEKDFWKLLPELSKWPRIDFCGLMTMAPLSNNAENSRGVFRSLKKIRDKALKINPNLKYLSMGMSQDFEVGIEEGATHIRVGSSLFKGDK